MVHGKRGQQYGPLSDAEMTKFRELGHLKTSDLVWRKGFADWRAAKDVFGIAK
jgi:GYF domain 2